MRLNVEEMNLLQKYQTDVDSVYRRKGWSEVNKDNSEISNNKKSLVMRLTYDLPVLRARLGISQEELAAKIGISRQTYNTIENGEKEMSWTTFLALVAVFQNNSETLKMLKTIDGIEDELRLL